MKPLARHTDVEKGLVIECFIRMAWVILNSVGFDPRLDQAEKDRHRHQRSRSVLESGIMCQEGGTLYRWIEHCEVDPKQE